MTPTLRSGDRTFAPVLAPEVEPEDHVVYAIRGDGAVFLSTDPEDTYSSAMPDGVVPLAVVHLVTGASRNLMGPGPAADLVARVVGHYPN